MTLQTRLRVVDKTPFEDLDEILSSNLVTSDLIGKKLFTKDGTVVEVVSGESDLITTKGINLRIVTNTSTSRHQVMGSTFMWHWGRNSIPSGCVPRDGQLLDRAAFPLFWAWVQTTGRVISEAEWQQNPAKRAGFVSDGDGTSNFRMQDANGAQEGSFKAVYERGSYGHGFEEGDTHGDAIRNITGTIGRTAQDQQTQTGGAFLHTSTASDILNAASSGSILSKVTSFDASRVVPTTDPDNGENRTVALVGTAVIRVAGGVLSDLDVNRVPSLLDSNTFSGDQKFSGRVEFVAPRPNEPQKVLTGAGWRSVEGVIPMTELTSGITDITGIPEWATRISVHIMGFSTVAAADARVRVLDVNGNEVSDIYNIVSTVFGTATIAGSTNTSFIYFHRNAIIPSMFWMDFVRFEGVGWSLNAGGKFNSGGGNSVQGTVTLDAPISGVRIFSASSTINGGLVKIFYQ